jgi:ABC-type multidrug transport system fused ATPase/permease subunit
MEYINDDAGEYTVGRAMLFVVLIFVTQFISKLIFQNCRFYQLRLGATASHSLGALIYDKTLRISSATNKTYNKGDIVNFIQVDSKKLIFLAEKLPSVARLPFVLVLSMILLFVYFQYSFFTGFAFISIAVVINYFLAKLTMRFQMRRMQKLDIRMNLMTECFDNIQFIKLNGWTDQFVEKVNEARVIELAALFQRFMLANVNVLMIY